MLHTAHPTLTQIHGQSSSARIPGASVLRVAQEDVGGDRLQAPLQSPEF